MRDLSKILKKINNFLPILSKIAFCGW